MNRNTRLFIALLVLMILSVGGCVRSTSANDESLQSVHTLSVVVDEAQQLLYETYPCSHSINGYEYCKRLSALAIVEMPPLSELPMFEDARVYVTVDSLTDNMVFATSATYFRWDANDHQHAAIELVTLFPWIMLEKHDVRVNVMVTDGIRTWEGNPLVTITHR